MAQIKFAFIAGLLITAHAASAGVQFSCKDANKNSDKAVAADRYTRTVFNNPDKTNEQAPSNAIPDNRAPSRQGGKDAG